MAFEEVEKYFSLVEATRNKNIISHMIIIFLFTWKTLQANMKKSRNFNGDEVKQTESFLANWQLVEITKSATGKETLTYFHIERMLYTLQQKLNSMSFSMSSRTKIQAKRR